MTVAVKDAGEGFIIRSTQIYPVSDDIEIRPRIRRKVNIRHQLKVVVPVFCVGPDGIHLLGCVNQVWVVGLSSTAAILCLSRQAGKVQNHQQ